MNPGEIREKEIGQLLSQLISSRQGFSDESFEQICFDKLCLYFYDSDIEVIYQHLMKEGDTQSFYWLIQYFVKIQRPLGFEKLFLLSKNDNEVMRQEACSGIKKISQKEQVDILVRLLEEPHLDNVVFAVKQLGELRTPRAVAFLMELLKKYENNEKICLNTLKALGNISDRRSIIVLEEFSDKKTGKIQQEALMALGRFKEFLHKKYVTRWLKSDNIKIKEFVCLRILRNFDPHWERYIVDILSGERNEELLGNILSSLRNIRTKALFDSVLYLSMESGSRRLRMLAQAILKKIKSKRQLNWLVRQERKSHEKQKEIIFNVLSVYPDEPVVFNIFRRNFCKSDSLKIRLIALEYVGLLKDTRVISFLMDIIKNDDNFSFAAAASLISSISSQKWEVVQEVLLLDSTKRSLCIEIFLKFILRLPFDCHLPEFIKTSIKNLTRCEFDATRYLAVRCMVRVMKAEKFSGFLAMIHTESNVSICQAAKFNIFEYVNRSANDLIFFLSMGQKDPGILPLINRPFRKVVLTKEPYEKVLKILLENINKCLPEEETVLNREASRWMVLLRHHMTKEKSLFLNALIQENWSDRELWIIMKVLNTTNIHRLKGISINFMADFYARASISLKQEFLIFFQKTSTKSKVIEDVIFNDLRKFYENDFSDKLNEVIEEWISR